MGAMSFVKVISPVDPLDWARWAAGTKRATNTAASHPMRPAVFRDPNGTRNVIAHLRGTGTLYIRQGAKGLQAPAARPPALQTLKLRACGSDLIEQFAPGGVE